MGPVSALAQLAEAKGSSLGPAIAAVAQALDQACKPSKSGTVDVELAQAVAAGAAQQLDRAGVATSEHAAPLLALTSRALSLLRAAGPGKASANPDTLQYSLIRKLVGHGVHAAALEQGWELFDSLEQTAAGKGNKPATGAALTAAQSQLLIGAVINLVACTAEADMPDPGACGRLGEAVTLFAAHLRSQQGSNSGCSGNGAASQSAGHADAVVRYLLKAFQQLGAAPAGQLAAAAAGIPALLRGLLQACALSSQPDKLPQVLARAAGALPPELASCCFDAVLYTDAASGSHPAAANWLEPDQASAALTLALQLARHKGASSRWAVALAGRVAAEDAHPLCGVWVASLALQQPSGGVQSACSEAAAAGAGCLQQLAASCEEAASSSRGAGAKGSSRGAKGAVAEEEEALVWELHAAQAALSQLQQAATAAASSGGALQGSSVPLDQVAGLLLLGPQLSLPLTSTAADPAAPMAAIAAAAETLTAGGLGGCSLRGEAWKQVADAAESHLEALTDNDACAAAGSQLQHLAVALHNAASALAAGGDAGGSSAAASGAARLLAAAFHASLRRATPALAQSCSAEAAASAVDDLTRRAKAHLSGLLRCAPVDASAAAEAGARTVAALVAALGPQRALQQQAQLQSVLRLHIKLALAASPLAATAAARSSKGTGRSKAGGSNSGSASLCSTELIISADPSGAAAEIADVVSVLEARCLASIEARGSAVDAEQARRSAACATAAAASAPTPPGWSDAEWGAQAQLVSALCADGGGVDAAALEDAAGRLSAGIRGSSGSSKPKAKAKPAASRGRARQQQQEEEEGGDGRPGSSGDGAAWVAASKAEAAALCRCLAALQAAYTGAEAAAVAAAEVAASAADGEDDAVDGAQPSTSSSGGSTSSSSSVGGAKATSSKRGGGKGRDAVAAAAAQQQGAWSGAVAASWEAVEQGLEEAADLWQAAAEAGAAATSGAGSSSSTPACVCRLPAASVQAALQAWHVAGLQGWATLQQRLATLLGVLLPSLPQSEALQLAPALAAMPQGCWLSYLLAPDGGNFGESVGDALGLPGGAGVAPDAAVVGPLPREQCQQLLAAAEEFEAQIDAGDGPEGPWARLNAARLHLAAARAAAATGEVPQAAAAAERAMALAGHIYAACTAPGEEAGSSGSSGNGAAAGSMDSSALDAAEPMDVDSRGSSSDQIAAPPPPPPQQQQQQQQLKPAAPAPPSVHSAGSGLGDCALQWQSLALYLSALLQLARAHEVAGAPDDATRLLREAVALAAAARCAGVAAAAHAEAARVWCRRGDQQARAEAQLRLAEAAAEAVGPSLEVGSAADSPATVLAALVACARGEVAAAAGDSKAARRAYTDAVALAGGAAGGGSGPAWWAGELSADAHAGLAACDVSDGDAEAAAARLSEAQNTICPDRWPVASAALGVCLWELRAAEAAAKAEEGGQAAGGGLQLVAFGGSSGHSNLLEEFACAVEDAGAEEAKAAKGRARSSKATGTTARSSKAGTTTARSAAKKAVAAAADAAVVSTGAPLPLRPLLALLGPCRHAPLLLKRVCSLLAEVGEARGAVHATAAFLQLSIGASVTEQQRAMVAARQQQLRRRAARRAARGSAPDGDDRSSEPDWDALRDALSCEAFVGELSAAAAKGSGSSDEALAAAADAAARRWLAAALARLPPGTAAVSISEAPRRPGLVVCRMAGPEVPPLVAVLPAPAAGLATSPADLAAVLAAILDDSSASMAGAGTLSTEKGKADWWRARLALDTRLAALLKHVSRDWLGPWRCLLAPAAVRGTGRAAELRAAAEAFVAEHFDSVFDDQSREMLTQLVSLLLASPPTESSSSSSGLQRAMLDLCQITGHRLDGLHLDNLVSALQEAREALPPEPTEPCTAIRESSGSSGGGSSSRGDSSGGGEQPAAPPKTPAAAKGRSRLAALSGQGGGGAPAAAAPSPSVGATPVATPAAAKRAPRGSRLAAMSVQKAVAGLPLDENGDNGAAALAGLMATSLRIDDSQPVASAAKGGAPATAAAPPVPRKAAQSRRMRFCADDENGGEDEGEHASSSSNAVVPPSVARHAVRRDQCISAPSLPPLPAEVSGAVAAKQAAAPRARSRLAGSRPAAVVGGAEADAGAAAAFSCPAVVLLLASPLHQLPWESCPGVARAGAPLYRCPSLAVAAAIAARATAVQPAPAPPVLGLSRGFYLLNPDGDLPDTQGAFEGLLGSDLGLPGTSGRRPGPGVLTEQLAARDLFLYFGHGSGQQYLSPAALRRLPRCAGGLLMGCSSGRLRGGSGWYEPGGAIWGYLLAGCPAAVANLWDVTDRDIDRFGRAVLDGWRGGFGSTKNSSSSSDSSSSSSEGEGAGGARGRRGGSGSGAKAFGGAVAESRGVCRLPHLIGAAPVVYGVPCLIDPSGVGRRTKV